MLKTLASMGSCFTRGSSESDETALGERWIMQELTEHTGGINCLAISDDRSVLATGSDDCTVRIYSTRTGGIGGTRSSRRTFDSGAESDDIYDEATSGIATPAAVNGAARSTAWLSCVGVLEGHSGYVSALAFAHEFLFSGSVDRSVRKWDVATCECVQIFSDFSASVSRLLFAPAIGLVFGAAGDVRAWDPRAVSASPPVPNRRSNRGAPAPCPAEVTRFPGHRLVVMSMIYVPARATRPMMSQMSSRVSSEWGSRIGLGTTPSHLKNPGMGPPTAASTGLGTGRMGTAGSLSGFASGRELGLLVTGSADCTVISWSVSSARRLHVFRGHEGGVSALAIDSSSKVLITASIDKSLRTWMLHTGQALRSFSGHDGAVTCLHVRTVLCNALLFWIFVDLIIQFF